MGRSPGFGSTSCDYGAQLRLAFASAPHLKCLTLPHNVTRWPVLQKVRGHANNALPQLVSVGFQVLFHSPPGVLFPTVPFAIGRLVVFSLGGWSPLLPTRFHVSRGTLDHIKNSLGFVYGTITLYGWSFQTYSTRNNLSLRYVRNPKSVN